eukprot:TRINITY_DN1877_c0_g1_i1.p1 TRINITY_DN1877_c0_g1~~TRINITY_DN1877_c0_g1_i1.p1  ORF type:complete len:709 (+),score=198.81 TRINITY_DN1877_c0_g1_i1:153-2279(+)
MTAFSLVLLVLAVVAIVPAVLSSPDPKHLAGPPSEFPLHIIPSPASANITQQSVNTFVYFESNANDELGGPLSFSTWSSPLTVDSTKSFSFVLFTPISPYLTTTLKDPSGNDYPLTGLDYPGGFQHGDEWIPETTYVIPTPILGNWTLTVTASSELTREVAANLPITLAGFDGEPDGLLVLYNEEGLVMQSQLFDYNLTLGREIGMQASIIDTDSEGNSIMLLQDQIESATMHVSCPDGTVETVQMYDDGLHMDGDADDGTFGAEIPSMETGQYSARAMMTGTNNAGDDFVRSTEVIVPVVAPTITLTGKAVMVTTTLADGSLSTDRVNLLVQVLSDAEPSTTFRPYAEVWMTQANGTETPLSWVSGITEVIEYAGNEYLALELDLQWLARSGKKSFYTLERSLAAAAAAPNSNVVITLKNVWVQDPASQVPLVQAASVPVTSATSADGATLRSQVKAASRSLSFRNAAITDQMRKGVRPTNLSVKTAADPSGPIVLVHGYCSKFNVFEESPEDWTDPMYFHDFNTNIGNDEFAKLIANFTENVPSFGLVAHSQGGLASTHLLNYYWSGLDSQAGKRLVQTLQSPFMGNTGAGTGADVISIFGFGCGSNTDLSVDGSSLWLAGITAETRANVYFYKTQYGSSSKYCNMATNLVLKKPNDGTAEVQYEDLEGANDMGLTEGWCHSAKMHYDPAYLDHSRNAIMNAESSR